MHYAYIIYSESFDVFYKGYSYRPFDRLEEHNDNKSSYTKGKGPWELVYLEEFKNKADALKREKQLKRANRNYIKWLIKQDRNLIK
jgi:putative endonuclease